PAVFLVDPRSCRRRSPLVRPGGQAAVTAGAGASEGADRCGGGVLRARRARARARGRRAPPRGGGARRHPGGRHPRGHLPAPGAPGTAEDISGPVGPAVGNLQAARDRFTRAGARFSALGVTWGVSNSVAALAWTALAAGDFDVADRFLGEAAAPAAAAGPWFSE